MTGPTADVHCESERRAAFFATSNAAWDKLRADPEAWREELKERALWDQTLMDDLENDPWPDDAC